MLVGRLLRFTFCCDNISSSDAPWKRWGWKHFE